MKIKILAPRLAGNVKGDVIEVPDIDNVPTEQFWRKRLRDAEKDKCCEVVSEAKPKPMEAENKAFKPTEDNK